jgi:CDP-diacylglycerol---serine O-phosphatidyltransferase
LFSSYMLNAEVPLFALKFSTWGFSPNKIRYLFLLYCLVLLIFLEFAAIPVIIISYVLLSVVTVRRTMREVKR